MENSSKYNDLVYLAKTREIGLVQTIKKLDLYSTLLYHTSFLSDHYNNVSDKQRLWHIKNGIYNVICKRDNIKIPDEFNERKGKYLSEPCNDLKDTKEIVKSSKFGVTAILKSLNLLDNVISLTSFLPEDSSLSQRYWHIRNNLYEIHICKVCNKNHSKYNERKACYHVCSDECKNKQNKEIAKSTSTKEKIEKIEKTCIERYGVKNYSQTEEFKEKSEQTCIERYGIKSYSQTEEFKSLLSEKIKSNDNSKSLEKSEKTCIERYGVKNYSQSKERLEKIFENNSIKFSESLPSGYSLVSYGNELTLHCNHCDKDFEIEISNYHRRKRNLKIICTNCNPLQENISSGEVELLRFVQSIYPGTIISNDRTLLSGMEIDIYLPELGLAIEYNGMYWHSSYKINSTYHRNKTNKCKEKGVHLIHVFEDQWIKQKEIVQSIICNFINNSSFTTYHARKLKISEIQNSKDVSLFLQDNHLLGKCQMSTCIIGLFDNDNLISLMSFKELIKNSGKFELQRYAIKKNSIVVGGAEKIFCNFLKKYDNLNSIITYNDNSVFKGKIYEKLGFTKIRTNEPNYFYIRKNSIDRISKQSIRKSTIGYESTENEFAKNNGLFRVYNSGNDVYQLEITK